MSVQKIAGANQTRGAAPQPRANEGRLNCGIRIRQTFGHGGFAARLQKSLSNLSKHLDVRALLRRLVALLQRVVHREPMRVAPNQPFRVPGPQHFSPVSGPGQPELLGGKPSPPRSEGVYPLDNRTSAASVEEAAVPPAAGASPAPAIDAPPEASHLSTVFTRRAEGRWPALLAKLAPVSVDARLCLVKDLIADLGSGEKDIADPDADPNASPKAFGADARHLSALLQCVGAARLDRTLQLVRALEQRAATTSQAHLDRLDKIKAHVADLLLAFLDNEEFLTAFLDDDNNDLFAFLRDDDEVLAPLLAKVRKDIWEFSPLVGEVPEAEIKSVTQAEIKAVTEAGDAFLEAFDPWALPPAPLADSDLPEPSTTLALGDDDDEELKSLLKQALPGSAVTEAGDVPLDALDRRALPPAGGDPTDSSQTQ